MMLQLWKTININQNDKPEVVDNNRVEGKV